jgi:NADH-quinone oxidoreductase subunit K
MPLHNVRDLLEQCVLSRAPEGVLIEHYLTLGAVLFVIGMVGVVSRRNALTVFMSIELMMNAANLTFLAFARARADLSGHVSAFFVIAVAAAEAAIGLAIVIAVFRTRGTTNVDEVRLMKL